MMVDINLLRGLFLALISLGFGLTAVTSYTIGSFNRPGPGLFPLMVSIVLLLVAVLTIIQSRFSEPKRLTGNVKNVSIILIALCSFAILTHFLNMTVGIIALVVIASFAASTQSWTRNAYLVAGLLAIAFALHKLLGLNLPLY